MIFISVNTPTKTQGIGAGFASDLKWIEASARQIAKFGKDHTIIVEKVLYQLKLLDYKIILTSSQVQFSKYF